jgi:hypothetical protein
MSDNTRHARIATYLQHVLQVCRDNPARIAVATANLKSLCDIMARYELSPRYYNELFDEGARPYVAPRPEPALGLPIAQDPDPRAFVHELETLFQRKITTTVLRQIGAEVARQLGLKLPRDAVRKSTALTAWFREHWPAIRRVIRESNLPQHIVFVETHAPRPVRVEPRG